MDVYHDRNIWGKGRPETKLTECPVGQTFLWEQQEILVPAVYVGTAGAALDVCAKIPTEEMAAFLKKWDAPRRMSLRTPEEFEQIEADNPAGREFTAALQLNATPLIQSMRSSMRWYPEAVIQMGNAGSAGEDRFENNRAAEEWMTAYDCDRAWCWYFERISYNWSGQPILSPRSLTLTFQATPLSITAGHFTTDVSCDGKIIKVSHPVTGQEYTLTLHGCAQTRQSFSGIGAKGVIYPEYCQILSYSITPQTDRSTFDIRDCAEGDHPKKSDSQKSSIREDGSFASTLFLAGKNAVPGRLTAVSALHFQPVEEVRWRIVFQIKPKEDMEIRLL